MTQKILITTVYLPNKKYRYDYLNSNTKNRLFKFFLPRIESAGLRFIKQNIPEIEILEYPTWQEFQQKIAEKQWDIIGFSFFMNETYEILQMVKYARSQGIPEIWAGNYGALTQEISPYFDRVFTGYSEIEIAKLLGKRLDHEEIIHPPIIAPAKLHFNIHLNCMGVLYTNRGCNNHCDFCQTPPFCPRPYKISLENIEKVLNYYKSIGISEIVILDENFGCFKKHAEEVINLLHKLGFYWFAMTRADLLNKRFNDWSNKRMTGAFIGIESFNQQTLNKMNKKETTNDIISVAKKMKENNKFIIGYYMLGFENDTKESIKRDLKKLASLKLDITQLCVVTPFPRTPQWDYLESKYGIIDRNWHHYNAKHLVWNHPNISPKEMKFLLEYGFRLCYPQTRIIETSLGFIKRYIQYNGYIKGIGYTLKHFIHSNTFNYFPQEKRLIQTQTITKSKKTDIKKTKEISHLEKAYLKKT